MHAGCILYQHCAVCADGLPEDSGHESGSLAEDKLPEPWKLEEKVVELVKWHEW